MLVVLTKNIYGCTRIDDYDSSDVLKKIVYLDKKIWGTIHVVKMKPYVLIVISLVRMFSGLYETTRKNSGGSGDKMDVDGGDEEQTRHLHRLPPPPLLPKNPSPHDLTVYETEADIRALIAWLNESGQREGSLRAAILRAFPPPPTSTRRSGSSNAGSAAARSPTPQLPMDVVQTAGDATSGGEGAAGDPGHGSQPGGDSPTGSVAAVGGGTTVGQEGSGGVADSRDRRVRGDADADSANGEVGSNGPAHCDDGDGERGRGDGESTAATEKDKGNAGAAGGEAGGGGAASVTDGRRRGRGGNGSGEPRVTLAPAKRSQELPQLLAEGKVELRMAVNPPGAHGNVMMPASEAVVEFENDAAADQVRSGSNFFFFSLVLSSSEG